MDSFHMAVSHRSGTPLNFQAIVADYETNNPTKIVSVNSATSLATAIGQLNAGTIDVIVVEDGTYNFPAYQTPITAQRTASNRAYIGARNKGKVFIGTNATSANPGNQWVFSGSTYVFAWMGFVFRYAYRSTSNPKLGIFTSGAQFNRLTGFTLINCGGASEDRVIEVVFNSHDNTIDNYIVDGTNGIVVAVNAWDAAIRISGVTRNGSTATYTFTPNPTYPLQTGHVVDIEGFTQTEYNVTGATITVLPSGTQFTCTVSGTPASPGTFYMTDTWGLIYPVANAEVRRDIHRISQRTTCAHATYMNTIQNQVANNNNNNLLFQDVTGRYGMPRKTSAAVVSNMWVQNCQTEWQMKGSDATIHDIINVSTNGGDISCRAGTGKQLYNIFSPYGGVGLKDKDNAFWNMILKVIDMPEGGKLDGTNNGTAAYDSFFGPSDNCTFDNITLLEGGSAGAMALFKRSGYGSYVTETPNVNVDFKNFLLISAINQVAINVNGKTLPDYLTTNDIVFDGFHYYLTGGATAGVTSSNNTSGNPNLEGGVRPTASTPSDVLTGGVSSSITTDMEGRPFTGRGGLGFTPMDPLFTAGFTGSANVPLTDAANYTPTLNELGSNLITATVSYLLNGSGAAYATQDFASNVVNTNAEDHHIRIVWNAGGAANRFRIWIGTNASLTMGFCIEVYPNGNTVTIYEADGVTLAFPVIPLNLSNTADIGIDGIRVGTHYTWRVNGWPMPTIAETGTGQYVGWQRGVSANNAGLIKSINIETSATSTGGGGEGGGTPSTPELLFDDTFTGSFSDISLTTPVIGNGYTLIQETASNSVPMVRQGDGNLRGNVASEAAYGLYSLSVAGTATPYTTMGGTIGYRNGAASAAAILLAMHVVDINNMPIVQWRRNSISLWFRQSGTFTQKGSSVNYDSQLGDHVYLEYTTDHHYKIYLNGNVVLDYDDSSSPAFPNAGGFWLGMGNFVQSTSLLHSNFGLTDFTITQYVEDPEVPPEAPIATTTPAVVNKGQEFITAAGAANIAGKHYFAAHIEDVNYTAADIPDIIAGLSPTGATLTTKAVDLDVAAGELSNLPINNLSVLTASGKTPPFANWGYTITAADDTQMVTVYAGKAELPTDVVDTNNPQPGEFNRFKLASVSTLNPLGELYLRWGGSLIDGAYIEHPFFTDDGLYRVTIDPITGDLEIDTQGNPATISGLNAWIPGATDWIAGLTGATKSITTPYQAIIDALEFTNNTGTKTASGTPLLVSFWTNGNSTSVHRPASLAEQQYTVAGDNTVTLGYGIAGIHYVVITDTVGNKLWADYVTFA